MKKIIKTLSLVALMAVVSMTPLCAQTEQTEQTEKTTETNATPATPAAEPKPKQSSGAEVRIGPDGVYVNGPHIPNGMNFSGPTPIEAMIVIVAIVTPFICIVAIGGLIFESRRRRNQMLHETIRAMIEKGVPIPPELLSPQKAQFNPPQSPFDAVFPSNKKSDLRAGLIMVAIGFGLLFFFKAIDMKIWPVGFIFILLGFALLLVHRFEKKNAAKTEVAPK